MATMETLHRLAIKTQVAGQVISSEGLYSYRRQKWDKHRKSAFVGNVQRWFGSSHTHVIFLPTKMRTLSWGSIFLRKSNK